MRLGQMSRKLAISPSEIIAYLATHNISVDDNTNTRLDDTHVDLVLKRFAPHLTTQEIEPLTLTADNEGVTPPDSQADYLEQGLPATEPQSAPEENDVIKAPKIELSGLRVLGKIELPETKKKEVPLTEKEQSDAKPEQRGSYQERRQTRDRRSYKNPISAQREKEMQEELEKRKEKAAIEKEKKTQNYLKKVKLSPPTKAARLNQDEQVVEMTQEELMEKPRSWFGKLIDWLSS